MKVYVTIPYTDADGKHEVGEEVEFAAEDKEGVARLIDYGIVSKTAPKDDDTSTSGQKQG